jgi:hypothetical protein
MKAFQALLFAVVAVFAAIARVPDSPDRVR